MSEATGETGVSKEYVDALLAHVPDPLFVLSPDGRIGSLNRAALELLGRREAELLGEPLAPLFAEKNNPLAAQGLDRLIEREPIKGLELTLAPRQEEGITVLLSCSLLKDKEGRVSRIICVARDITARKKLEKRMARFGELLGVGQLAAGVAHELNNPLGVILMFAQGVLRRIPEEDPLRPAILAIERESQRCARLVRSLLSYSRSSKAESQLLDLTELAEEAIELVQAKARMLDVEVRRELAPNLPRVRGDRAGLERALINIAANALDAMPDGGCLAVSSGRQGETVWVRLSDTGPGLSKEAHKRLFEPFFTTKEEGAGLGLSSASETIRLQGGTIEVESEPGRGAAFRVRLPAARPGG